MLLFPSIFRSVSILFSKVALFDPPHTILKADYFFHPKPLIFSPVPLLLPTTILPCLLVHPFVICGSTSACLILSDRYLISYDLSVGISVLSATLRICFVCDSERLFSWG